MPAVIVKELEYDRDKDNYYLDLWKFLDKLPNIKEGHYIFGVLEFCKIDKKVEKEINASIEMKIEKSRGIFTYPSKEVIKKQGITPNSWITVVIDSYKESYAASDKYPIYPGYFEIIEVPDALKEEIENRFKGAEEIVRLLRITGVTEELLQAYEDLRNAYLKFKAGYFEDTKTSCRKVLEIIREIIKTWETIDDSEHLSSGILSLTKTLYSISSSGGPHPGKTTADETEVIFNSTLYLFKYVNKIINEKRYRKKDETSRG